MHLSVIHRIIGGFSLLLMSLIGVGVVGIDRIQNINTYLYDVTEQAGPIRNTTEQLSNILSNLNLMMYRHYNSVEQSEINRIEEAFNDRIDA